MQVIAYCSNILQHLACLPALHLYSYKRYRLTPSFFASNLAFRELRSSGREDDAVLAQSIKDSYINKVRVATQVGVYGGGCLRVWCGCGQCVCGVSSVGVKLDHILCINLEAAELNF